MNSQVVMIHAILVSFYGISYCYDIPRTTVYRELGDTDIVR